MGIKTQFKLGRKGVRANSQKDQGRRLSEKEMGIAVCLLYSGNGAP